MRTEGLCQRSEDGQCGEVRADIATVEGGEAVGLNTGVGGDEEIRECVCARTALAPITKENLAGEVSGGGADGIVGDAEGVKIG